MSRLAFAFLSAFPQSLGWIHPSTLPQTQGGGGVVGLIQSSQLQNFQNKCGSSNSGWIQTQVSDI